MIPYFLRIMESKKLWWILNGKTLFKPLLSTAAMYGKMRSKILNAFFLKQLFFKRCASYLSQFTNHLNANYTEMFVNWSFLFAAEEHKLNPFDLFEEHSSVYLG